MFVGVTVRGEVEVDLTLPGTCVEPSGAQGRTLDSEIGGLEV